MMYSSSSLRLFPLRRVSVCKNVIPMMHSEYGYAIFSSSLSLTVLRVSPTVVFALFNDPITCTERV